MTCTQILILKEAVTLVRSLLILFLFSNTFSYAAADEQMQKNGFVQAIRDTVQTSQIIYPFESAKFRKIPDEKLTGYLPGGHFEKKNPFRFVFNYDVLPSEAFDLLIDEDADEESFVDCGLATQIYYLAAIHDYLGSSVFDATIAVLAENNSFIRLGFELDEYNVLTRFLIDTESTEADLGDFVYCAECPAYHQIYTRGFGGGYNAIVTSTSDNSVLYSALGFYDSEVALNEIRDEIFDILQKGPAKRYKDKNDKTFENHCTVNAFDSEDIDAFVGGISHRLRFHWLLLFDLSKAKNMADVSRALAKHSTKPQ